MKLNCSSCLFFGCECFGTCTCVCKLLILLCCQINVFKSFRAKRGRGHFPLPDPPPFGDPHPLWVHIFFFRTPPFPDLATGLIQYLTTLPANFQLRDLQILGHCLNEVCEVHQNKEINLHVQYICYTYSCFNIFPMA